MYYYYYTFFIATVPYGRVKDFSRVLVISFQHKLLRRILKISIYEVVENHITNAEVRK